MLKTIVLAIMFLMQALGLIAKPKAKRGHH